MEQSILNVHLSRPSIGNGLCCNCRKVKHMGLKIQWLPIVLIFGIQLNLNAQVSNVVVSDSTEQQRIKKVENSLSPHVLGKDRSRWNIEEQMKKYNVPGLSVAVINGFKIDWAKGYGETGHTEKRSVTEFTVFQAASMSKFVNAIGLLKLHQLQKIDLDRDINQYLTSWKYPYNESIATVPITIRQLLSHTAGLSTHGFSGYKDASILPNIIQILEGSQPANSDSVDQIFPPNQEFKYSGGGTMITQLVVMDVSNSPYEKFINDYVFVPLGMNRSFYSIEFDKYPKELALGYLGNGKPLKNRYNIYPESAAAGLWTTPTDLAKLIIDVQLGLHVGKGKILSRESVEELSAPVLQNTNSALGLFTEKRNGELYLQHSGSNRGFRGKFIFGAENGNGVVVMVNGINTEIIEEIIRSVALVYKWEGFDELVAAPELNLKQMDLNKFVGTYNLDKRSVEVTLKKGQLILSEKGKWKSGLTPLNNNTFVVDIVKPQATIEFISDVEGIINGCIMNQGGATEWVKHK